jgi:tripartite-type tricarboxylate transporter receptor subunit TctC
MVVGFAAGGGNDLLARIIGQKLSENTGQPVVIENNLEAELRRVLADAGVRAKIRAMAYEGGGGPGEEFRQRIDTDIKVFADVIKAANLKFE